MQNHNTPCPMEIAAGAVCFLCASPIIDGNHDCLHDSSRLLLALKEEPIFKQRFEVLEIIGIGGMGVIFKAKQRILHKMVAVKMLHSHLVMPRALQRFELEGKATGMLKHPYIVSVHDFGVTASGKPYMIMDYVEGRTLERVIKEDGPLSIKRSVSLFSQVCEALAYAHRKSVIHRDIKPSNIMLTVNDQDEEEVRIMDFGIAKLMDAQQMGSLQLTRTNEAVGSPMYMSPEQIRASDVTIRSDIYSLGCVMYEALTGVPVFAGSSSFQIMLMHVNENEKPLTLSQATLGSKSFDDRLERLIARMLEKDLNARYRNMDEVRQVLLGMDNRSVGGGPLRLIHESQPPAAVVTGPQLAIAVVALICMIGVVITFVLLRPTQTAHRYASSAAEWLGTVIATGANQLDCSLILDKETVGDADLEPLKEGEKLQVLGLEKTNISDAGLKNLSNLHVQSLDLSFTNVRGLAALANMSSLTSLNLSATALDSSGMATVSTLANLEVLLLDNTGIHDADLVSLKGLSRLRKLSLAHCSYISAQAVNTLKGCLPNCEINFVPVVMPVPVVASRFYLLSRSQLRALSAAHALQEVRSLMSEQQRLYESKKYAEAEAKVKNALTIALAHRKDMVVHCLNYLTLTQRTQRHWEDAMQTMNKRIKLAEEENARDVLPVLHIWKADLLFHLNRIDEAMACAEQADRMLDKLQASCKKLSHENTVQKASNFQWMAERYQAMSNDKEVVEFASKALKTYIAAGEHDSIGAARCLVLIGSSQARLRNPKLGANQPLTYRAFDSFLCADRLLHRLKPNYDEEVLVCDITLAELCCQLEQINRAVEIVRPSLNYPANDDLRLRQYSLLSRCCAMLKKSDEANFYGDRARELQQKLAADKRLEKSK